MSSTSYCCHHYHHLLSRLHKMAISLLEKVESCFCILTFIYRFVIYCTFFTIVLLWTQTICTVNHWRTGQEITRSQTYIITFSSVNVEMFFHIVHFGRKKCTERAVKVVTIVTKSFIVSFCLLLSTEFKLSSVCDKFLESLKFKILGQHFKHKSTFLTRLSSIGLT